MPQSLEDLLMTRPPTPDRPLLGVMTLVVEDSRFTCEALRLICQRSGARVRRAESIRSAERHLRAYRPRIAIVDLGLPDGSGLDLIRSIAHGENRIEGIIAISGDDDLRTAALEAGADSFMSKPISSITDFQTTALNLLRSDFEPTHEGGADTVVPDEMALRDDLSLAADLLDKEPEAGRTGYIAAFLAGLGKSSNDEELSRIAEKLSEDAKSIAAAMSQVQLRLGKLGTT